MSFDLSRRKFLSSGAAFGVISSFSSPALAIPFREGAEFESLDLENYNSHQALTEKFIEGAYSKGILKPEEKVSVLVSNLRNNSDYVNFDGSLVLPLASLVKPYACLGYTTLSLKDRKELGEDKFEFKDEDGLEVVDIDSKAYLCGGRAKRKIAQAINYGANRDQIIRSNRRANEFMRLCGGPKGIETLITREIPSITEKINIVELIPWGGRTYLNSGSMEANRDLFKYLVETKEPWTEVVRSRAKTYGERIRFDVLRSNVKKQFEVYKSGTTTKTTAAAMVIYDSFGPALFAGLNVYNPIREDPNHVPWARNLIDNFFQPLTSQIADSLQPKMSEIYQA